MISYSVIFSMHYANGATFNIPAIADILHGIYALITDKPFNSVTFY